MEKEDPPKNMELGTWIPFVALILLLLGAFGIPWIVGNTSALDSMAAATAPLVAGLVGVYGLTHFAPRGLVREDRFHVMFIFLSVGLFVMLLAELAGIAIESSGVGASLVFTVGFVQILGMISFSIGVGGYFNAVNKTVGYSRPQITWSVVVAFPLAFVVILVALSYDPLQSVSFAELVTSGIVSIGFGVTALCVSIIAVVFRRGRLLMPAIFILLGLLLLFARGVVWAVYAVTPVLTSSRILGAAAYAMIGGAITAARVNES
ncbi:MAG: hypothetical protein JSW61_12145 [Candidatus Thorarchaeota archaeon]|nr:MAG: hypothetical protein JSW61_12145 [Candidatus Thorarchaeota archaeon]